MEKAPHSLAEREAMEELGQYLDKWANEHKCIVILLANFPETSHNSLISTGVPREAVPRVLRLVAESYRSEELHWLDSQEH